jgi:hypothetical protein
MDPMVILQFFHGNFEEKEGEKEGGGRKQKIEEGKPLLPLNPGFATGYA